MKLGASGQLLSEIKTLEEIIILFKRYGIENIEIWPENIPYNEGVSEISPNTYEGRNIAWAKEILKKHDINAVCVTMPGAFDKEVSSSIEGYSSALKYAVETASELGAKYVNHYCYYLCLNEVPDIDMLRKFMEPALRLAEEAGIILCLENEAHDATITPEGTLAIIKAMNSKSFKTNFDAANYYHGGQEGFPNGYEILKEHIAYVHLKNCCIYNPALRYREENKGTAMTGVFEGKFVYYPVIREGAVNVDGLLMALKRDGYDSFCVLEPHTIPEHAEKYYEDDINYLKEKGFF